MEKNYQEAEETVRRSILENHSVDNCVLELNALKMACNITFHDLRASAIPALIQAIDMSKPETGTKVPEKKNEKENRCNGW